jgi:hypothetical protein
LTLTLAWFTLFMGDISEGAYTLKKESNYQTMKIKIWSWPHWGLGTKTNWRTDCRSQYNLNLNLHHCIANYRPVLSSERAPYMKNKGSNFLRKKCTISSAAPEGAGHQDELAD